MFEDSTGRPIPVSIGGQPVNEGQPPPDDDRPRFSFWLASIPAIVVGVLTGVILTVVDGVMLARAVVCGRSMWVRAVDAAATVAGLCCLFLWVGTWRSRRRIIFELGGSDFHNRFRVTRLGWSRVLVELKPYRHQTGTGEKTGTKTGTGTISSEYENCKLLENNDNTTGQ